MTFEIAIHHAQVYHFLAGAFLYPRENWLPDAPLINGILEDLGLPALDLEGVDLELPELQAWHRHAFGLAGSLCYETEYGLPHEFRQSQELADLAGFYRAFGFRTGGPVRERPDHLAMELEFCYLLCLKEAHALVHGISEQVEICREAQRKFLSDHLGRWVDLFARALAGTSWPQAEQRHSSPAVRVNENPYPALAYFTARFVAAHAKRIGARPQVLPLAGVKPTPPGPELSCGDCPLSGSL